MQIAYIVIALVLALMATMSGVLKLRQDPRIVKSINEVVGVPMKFLPILAALEFAGAVGLLVGVRLPVLGVAAACGLVLYFVGAVFSHVRVGDFKGIGGAVFMLVISVAALATRLLSA